MSTIKWYVSSWLDRHGEWQTHWHHTIDVFPSPLGHVWVFYRGSQDGIGHHLALPTIGM